MDINSFRALSTVLVAIAFAGVCWWAFSPKRKKQFEDAAQLPFADEKQQQETSAVSENEEPDNKTKQHDDGAQ